MWQRPDRPSRKVGFSAKKDLSAFQALPLAMQGLQKTRDAPETHKGEEARFRRIGVVQSTRDGGTSLAMPESHDEKLVLQEILSKPSKSKKPMNQQEFYELRINDWTDSWRPGFAVIGWRISWSEIDKQFMRGDEQAELWPTLDSAKNRYEARLRALKEKGWVHSDMEF